MHILDQLRELDQSQISSESINNQINAALEEYDIKDELTEGEIKAYERLHESALANIEQTKANAEAEKKKAEAAAKEAAKKAEAEKAQKEEKPKRERKSNIETDPQFAEVDAPHLELLEEINADELPAYIRKKINAYKMHYGKLQKMPTEKKNKSVAALSEEIAEMIVNWQKLQGEKQDEPNNPSMEPNTDNPNEPAAGTAEPAEPQEPNFEGLTEEEKQAKIKEIADGINGDDPADIDEPMEPVSAKDYDDYSPSNLLFGGL